ncbi:hypothetical protein [Streptomyces griseoluteus]
MTADTRTLGLHGVHHDRGDHTHGYRFHIRGDQEHGSSRGGPAHTGTYQGANDDFSPWVADQLLMFDPRVKDQLATFDPWVRDQLATFAHPGNLGHPYFIND